MRELKTKYDGQCARCAADIETGASCMYEKSMGIFCLGCEPREVEDIRTFRKAKAERKAERYDEWAAKRESRATDQLNSHPEIRHDWAFITQPGRIPFRERMNRADDRACESLNKAKEMRSKAAGIRAVRVKGDAERRRQVLRDYLDTKISKGSRVEDGCFGLGTVVGVYKKSYRICFDRFGSTHSRDKSYVKPLESD